jgi:hypothetical protein
MLDAFVIEEIKRRERESGREDRPAAEVPLPPPPPASSDQGTGDGERPDPNRGVVIIDYS